MAGSGTGYYYQSVTTATPGYGKQPLTYFTELTTEELYEEYVSVHGDGSMEAPSEDPTVEEFLSWHSQEQLALIPDIVLNASGKITSGVTVIGESPNTLTVVKSLAGDRIYIIDLLQKRDIVGIPAEDQAVIVQTSKWLDEVSIALDMAPNSATPTVAEARSSITLTIETLISEISDPVLTYATGTFDGEPFIGQLEYLLDDVSEMQIISQTSLLEKVSEIEKRFRQAKAFFDVPPKGVPSREDFKAWLNYTTGYDLGDPINQYVIYDAEANGGSGSWIIYDRTDFSSDSEKARDHYKALTYDDLYDIQAGPYGMLVSTDGNAGHTATYEKLIQQEKQIYAVETQYRDVLENGVMNGKQLDGATLVSVLMLLIGLRLDAVVAIETTMIEAYIEEQKVINKLMDILNRQIGTMDASNASQTRGLFRMGEDNADKLTDEELQIIARFTDGLGGVQSPVLSDLGVEAISFYFIDWPTKNTDADDLKRYENSSSAVQNAIDPNQNDNVGLDDDDLVMELDLGYSWTAHNKSTWDTFGTRASALSSQVQQGTQIRQSELTTLSNQQTQWSSGAMKELTNLNQLLTRIGNNF